MPQFDKITFFNQLFWLLFFFSGFYLLLLHYFLPKLSSVLKARQKMLIFFLKGVSTMIDERNSTRLSVQNDCSQLLASKNLDVFLSSTFQFINWLKTSLLATFNLSLQNSLTQTEKRIYFQTTLYHYIMSKVVDNTAQ